MYLGMTFRRQSKMGMKVCKECGLKRDTLSSEGICYECGWAIQDEEERRKINATSMPEGFITTWNDTPSFLDKKRNFMYFRIPRTSSLFFDPEKEYQIIIKEVE